MTHVTHSKMLTTRRRNQARQNQLRRAKKPTRRVQVAKKSEMPR